MESSTVPVAQELIQQGHAIVRIENETQQQMAIQRPRVFQEIWKDVVEELTFLPEYAAKAYYSIPYKNQSGGTTAVEGPSIKAAMSLARRWGNCANGARYVDDKEDRLIVEGVFIDYETNVRTTRQVSVAKSYWSAQLKKVVPLREDRLNMAIQAGMSKAVRNAIIASLPVSLVEGYLTTARQVVASPPKVANKPKEDSKTRLAKARAKFLALGVDPILYDEYVFGSTMESDEELLAHLLGIYNSIEEGNLKIEDTFGTPKPKQPEGQVKSEELFK